jgi:hypothetical protein
MTQPSNLLVNWFERSPFGILANPTSAKCWAGRPNVLAELNRLRRAFDSRPDSSFHVMWANLGAGKSHALYHLAHLLGDNGPGTNAVCVYIEVPEQIRSFLDLYRRIIVGMPLERIASFLSGAPSTAVSQPLKQALNVLLHGDAAGQQVIRDWISGGRPRINDLRRVASINSKLDTESAAVDVVCEMIAILGEARCRLVLLLDEYQRVSTLTDRVRESVLSCLRSVFSRSPNHFSAVVAIMSRANQTAMDLVPPELRTLMGLAPPISLPEMDIEEAMEFVAGRLAYFRRCDYSGPTTGPFESEAIKYICEYLQGSPDVSVTPRNILHTMGLVFDEYSSLVTTPISADDVRRVLPKVVG